MHDIILTEEEQTKSHEPPYSICSLNCGSVNLSISHAYHFEMKNSKMRSLMQSRELFMSVCLG